MITSKMILLGEQSLELDLIKFANLIRSRVKTSVVCVIYWCIHTLMLNQC